MIIVNDTAIRADRNINAGSLVILIPGFGNFDECGCLTTANTFLFAGDADGTATDAHFYKIGPCFGQKEETFSIDHVTGANFYRITVYCAGPIQRPFLPLGEALGGIDTQNIGPCFDQSGDTLFVIAGVNTGSYYIPFRSVQQFQWVFFVGVIVLAKYHVQKPLIIVNNRETIQLVVPNDIIGFF